MPLPPALQQPLDAILSSIYNLQTSAGGGYKRFYSEIFRDLPARSIYPDYYQFIKEPRCMHDIMESLKRGAYSSPQAVAYDLFLIWSNAREYNEQGSLVYADADKLEGYMERLWRERSPPLPAWEALLRPGFLPNAAPAATPAASDAGRKVKRIKLTGASLGTPSTPTATLAGPNSTKLRIAPPSASPAPSPAPSTPSLTLKLGGNRAAAPESGSPFPQVALPQLPPALGTASTSAAPSPAVETPPAAGPSAKSSKKAEREAEADEDGEPAAAINSIPDVDPGWLGGELGNNPQQLYLDILGKLRAYTDASNRPLAEPLYDLPSQEARPDYYQLVSRPVSLNTIEANVKNGVYRSSELFDRDLHQLFENAKLFTRPDDGTTMYSDLLVLQRLYHELTKRKSAMERSIESSDPTAFPSITGGVSKRDDDRGATARPTTKDKIFLESVNIKGETLRVGDWVHLFNPDNPAKPVIAQIWNTYKRADSPQRCLSVCWYFRPEETVHPASRMFFENEVFKTGVFVDQPVEDFVGRCFVMFLTKYLRGRPKPPAWYPGMPLYVCEYRYKDDVKAFKKIKSWNSAIPKPIREHEYEYEPFVDDRVDQPAKVRSPFVPGGSASTEAPTPTYLFSHESRLAAPEEAAPAAAVAMDIDYASAASPMLDPAPPVAPVFDLAALTGVAAPAFPSPGFDGTDGPAAGAYAQVALTPAELAASNESFTPLPPAIKSKFRSDALGDLLWFTAPAADVPAVVQPTHSLDYLYWRALEQQRMDAGVTA
ncbi:hypothetical protein JCM10207_000393 [Rhodosporidiobolus poonsookiae]